MKINSVNDLHEFLTTYFMSQHCPIIDSQNGVLTVKLTEKMDRALMNSPFYWHYIKGTGNQVNPCNYPSLQIQINETKKESGFISEAPGSNKSFNTSSKTRNLLKYSNRST